MRSKKVTGRVENDNSMRLLSAWQDLPKLLGPVVCTDQVLLSKSLKLFFFWDLGRVLGGLV